MKREICKAIQYQSAKRRDESRRGGHECPRHVLMWSVDMSAKEHRTDVALEEVFGDVFGDDGLEFFEQVEIAAA